MWGWAGREFGGLNCCQVPGLLRGLGGGGGLRALRREEGVPAELLAFESEADLQSSLRKFRRRHMLRIIWRDLTRQASTMETTGDMTWLADITITAAMDFLYGMLAERWGTPLGAESGQRQELVVLGMGKMGAGEQHVASAIDRHIHYP